MSGSPVYVHSETLLKKMTIGDLERIIEGAVQKINKLREKEMSKENSKLVNRHKRLAMGEKIELKKGGKVEKRSKPKKK